MRFRAGPLASVPCPLTNLLTVACGCLLTVGCGGPSRGDEPQWAVVERFASALDALDAEAVASCFDTSDAASAAATARIRRGVAVMAKGRELEELVRGRFGEAVARETVGVVPESRALMHYRGILEGGGSIEAGDDAAVLRLRNKRPALFFVRRVGRWFLRPAPLFDNDANAEQQTDMLFSVVERHIEQSLSLSKVADSPADLRERLDAIGKDVKAEAAQLYSNLSTVLRPRGY